MDNAKLNKKRLTTKKKKRTPEDIYYPVPLDFNSVKTEKSPVNLNVIRRIVQGSVKAAYGLKNPSDYEIKYQGAGKKAVATGDQVEMIMHLIETLQPADAIEAALASQFAITYVRGIEESVGHTIQIDLFEFGHKALETLQKYRSKGAQQISVQYNVNQGQVVNIKNIKKDERSTIEAENL
jgi:hypothetical protein